MLLKGYSLEELHVQMDSVVNFTVFPDLLIEPLLNVFRGIPPPSPREANVSHF